MARSKFFFGNAGIIDSDIPYGEISDELWTNVIGVNRSGCFTVHASLPHLAKTRGNIVFTTSVAGLCGNVGGASYTASKYGVIGLVNQLACEAGPRGIRVNGVAPGEGARTNIFEGMAHVAATEAMVVARIPLERFAEPEEIAEPVLFLAVDAASFITERFSGATGGGFQPEQNNMTLSNKLILYPKLFTAKARCC